MVVASQKSASEAIGIGATRARRVEARKKPENTETSMTAGSAVMGPYANELIAAVESPGINGGVLTFVWDCIRRASPGSVEVFARRLARHLLSLEFQCTPTLPTCLQAIWGHFSQLERLNYPKEHIKTLKEVLHIRLRSCIMEDGHWQNYDISSYSLKEGNFIKGCTCPQSRKSSIY